MVNIFKITAINNFTSELKKGDLITFKDDSQRYWNDTDEDVEFLYNNEISIKKVERYIKKESLTERRFIFFKNYF